MYKRQEPTTALDVTIQAQIIDLMQELQKKLGMSIIFITHDLGVVSEISDHVMVMYLGNVMEIAETNELFNNPLHSYTKSLIDMPPGTGDVSTVSYTHLTLPTICSV